MSRECSPSWRSFCIPSFWPRPVFKLEVASSTEWLDNCIHWHYCCWTAKHGMSKESAADEKFLLTLNYWATPLRIQVIHMFSLDESPCFFIFKLGGQVFQSACKFIFAAILVLILCNDLEAFDYTLHGCLSTKVCMLDLCKLTHGLLQFLLHDLKLREHF